ncbi:protein kinase [Streptomyces ipomoeae]|nr:protein kinase [Streptomyces ipomoeae]MDX2698357.1 protein kinase [Streptomyces ipomoeae]MDX2825651.1 protein kinase [Streptomyces ipomoeae]MDX2843988.1 protein kinase [Streptomyces ipomoeae]MDX2875727.1 protein kinase [Streptomyces ipomoeae]
MAGDTPEQGQGRIINGRYRLLRTLGAGGMGRVWLAYDEELACEVSMKEISLPDVPMDAAEPAQRIARARSEARHAARLRGHPHVATVHDVVLHDGLPWIVMEYVPDAIDLQAVIRQRGLLTPEQVARIGLAVLDALTAGHRIGILHRDVKPANILLAADASGDPYARVLLTDYGIALQPESREPRLTATAGILGTPGYLAPERARGEPPTPAADMFSLGATLYAAVEGRGPFDRHGEYATLTALLGEEPTPPARAGELAPVLHGLLIKDPVRRLSPEAVARGLERVADAGGASTPPGWGATPAAAPEGFGPAPGGPGGGGPSGPGGHATAGTPPGYAASAPPGHVAAAQGSGGTPHTPGAPHTPGTPNTPGAPHAPWTPGTPHTPGVPGAPYTPGTPYTPAAPHTPGAPPTPNTPAGGPPTPGAGPSTPAGTPGGPSPYDPWQQAQPRSPYDGYNPYAGGQSTPYGGPAGNRSPAYGGAAGGQAPSYGSPPGNQSPAYAGSVGNQSLPYSANRSTPYGGGGGRPPGNAGFPTITAGTPPPGGPKRKVPAAGIVAIVVAVLLVVTGGTWALVNVLRRGGPTTGGGTPTPVASPVSEYPYGKKAALKQPLDVGDCVKAVWTGTAFKSLPDLGVVDCDEDWPDGQVVAIETASDYEEARTSGAERCANQAGSMAEALPDAGVYALLPTKEGFTKAKGGTACLVLGKHVPIGGEVGRLRDNGTNLWPTQMAVGDCWDYTTREDKGYDAPLTDCAEAHTDQVVGSVQAPDSMTFQGALDEGGKLCTNRFESTWAPGTDLIVSAWVSDEEEWKKGFNKVVCTVRNADVSRTTGKIPTPGSV